ncbi:MAG TPA: insulinase family protein [Ignavibacteriales bacterium]|nr:insulinase family protein [Ignavibacteriales bacterium]
MKKFFLLLFSISLNLFGQKYINISDNYFLKNGLEVLLISDTSYKTVTAGIAFKIPTKYQGQYIGYTTFLPNLLTQNSKNITSQSLYNLRKYGYLSIYANDDKISIASYKEYLDTVFYILSDLIINPNLSVENMIDFKKKVLPSVKKYNQEIANIAVNVYRRTAFEHNSPASEFPTQNSIIDISINVLKNHYHKYFIPNNATLIVVGNFDIKKIKNLIEKYFSTWQTGPQPDLNNDKNYFKDFGDTIAIVHANNMDTPFIFMASPFELSKRQKDITYVQLLSLMFGNYAYKFFYKDTLNKGYYTDAVFQNNAEHSAITIAKQIPYDSVHKFVEIYPKVYKNFFSSTIDPLELVKAKNIVISTIKSQLSNSNITFDFISDFKTNLYSNDFILNYINTIENINVDTLEHYKKSYIPLHKFYTVIILDTNKITPAFKEKFKYKIFDQYGNPVNTNLPPIPKDLTAQKIIQNYIEKITSTINVEKINNLMLTYAGEIVVENGKKQIETRIVYSLKDNKYFKHVAVDGQEDALQIYDGKQFFENSKFFGPRILDEKDTYQSLYNSVFLPQRFINDWNISVKLLGIEPYDTSYAYNIEFTDKYGQKWNEYYDYKSFLLIGYQKITKNVQLDIKEQNYYHSYTLFNGFLLPSKISSKVLSQTAEFSLKDVRNNVNLAKNFFTFKYKKAKK